MASGSRKNRAGERRTPLLSYTVTVAGVLLVVLAWVLVARPWGDSDQAENGPPQEEQRQEQQEQQEQEVLAPPTEAEIEAARQAGTVPVTLNTSRGDIELELRGDLMPVTVANFVKLARADFYDRLTFHRVEDWVIQGGDPNGNGTGGPGYTINLETNPELLNRVGAVAMARSIDPNSAGSQFYILKEDADWLDGQYAVFGRVITGMDVVKSIQPGDQIEDVIIED